MLTSKDFISTAKKIKSMQDRAAAFASADAMAEIFSNSNPRFDRERFFTACGIKDGSK